jgi:hypothetical protein
MKITRSLSSDKNHIHLKYDADAQSALLKAWRLVQTTLREPVVDKVFQEQGQVSLSRMKACGKVLHDLATAKERRCELTELDLNAAAELVMFVTHYRADFGESVSTLPVVVLLLSKVTTYYLPIFCLPPPIEVFDRSMAGSPAWESYKLIRQKGKIEPPSLTLMEMYELWQALKKSSQGNAQLDALEKCLDLVTRLFRGCMRSLAAAHLLSAAVSGERNGRPA